MTSRTTSVILSIGVLAALALIATGGGWPPVARAAVGAGLPENINVTCDADGAAIATTSRTMLSVTCECDAAVSWGDADVDDTTDYSATSFSGNLKTLYCEAADVACRCLALVPG